MNRDTYKTVTGFVLLVPASKFEAMGRANFLASFQEKYVRVVSLEDIQRTAARLKGVDADHFDACLYLKATMNGDTFAIVKSVDRFARVLDARQEASDARDRREREERIKKKVQSGWVAHSDGSFTKDFGDKGGVITELPSKSSFEFRSREAKSAPEFLVELYAKEITSAILSKPVVDATDEESPQSKPPQIVNWYFEGGFRPAIYCEDLKSALYIHTFLLAPTGVVGFRACPYDGAHFFQDRPNQEYCCPAHREAHRVARFRHAKKLKAAERQKKGELRGTKKAR